MLPNPPENSGLPPRLPESVPPIAGAPPLPLLPPASSKPGFLPTLLSVCLGLFLVEGIVALADDALIQLFGLHLLGFLRGLLLVLELLVAIVVYVLIGITPRVPKRLFLPLTLFFPVSQLLAILLIIYFYSRMQQIALLVSLCQVILGLGLVWLAAGGIKFQWPLVRENWLTGRSFSGWNLSAFVLANVFVLLPGVAVYLFVCLALAVSHFSAGFLALRPAGVLVQARTYVRDDGKTIQLFPMAHVADESFFKNVSQSFPTNSIVLMEGVTDQKGLLTNKISYKRLASALGLGEQHEAFRPTRGQLVRADVDIDQFTTNTIDLLNTVMLIHTKGLDDTTLLQLAQFTPPPDFPRQLFDDLLGLRNRHLLEEIKSHLPETDHIIVPWGAAHMPGISSALQKSGFHLTTTKNYMAIRFRSISHESADEKTR